MNCQATQNRILALPDPRQIPDPLREHVLACAACRAWAEQAARLEGLLEHLPVPPAPADKKGELIEDLTRDPFALPTPARRPYVVAGPSFLRRNARLVGALAAAVVVAVGAWVAFSGRGGPTVAQPAPTPKHPFLEKVSRRNVELAKVDLQQPGAAGRRLDILAGLADDLSSEARGLARIADPDELRDVAQWYDSVVRRGVVTQAERLAADELNVPAAERQAKLRSLAARLGEAAGETEAAAAEVPQNAKPTLERIATTARDGEKKLRELAQ